jgi:16S rRNA (adenine1518-N6/adenine1519-N6)-dimethyltransferase
MTQYLCESAREVVAIEIDKNLIPILQDTLSAYDNVTVINEDVLKVDIKKLAEERNGGKPVKVVANLPYYITTPIIMHLLENIPEIKRYSVMVQLEVADRIVANKGGKDYNNLTIAIGYRAKTYKAINVSRNVFMPKPNVDSAVVIFDIYDEKPYKVNNEKFFFELIRKAFANRRKTLVNNLNQGYNISKEEAVKILEEMNLSSTIRSEALSIEQFTLLSDILEKRLK